MLPATATFGLFFHFIVSSPRANKSIWSCTSRAADITLEKGATILRMSAFVILYQTHELHFSTKRPPHIVRSGICQCKYRSVIVVTKLLPCFHLFDTNHFRPDFTTPSQDRNCSSTEVVGRLPRYCSDYCFFNTHPTIEHY